MILRNQYTTTLVLLLLLLHDESLSVLGLHLLQNLGRYDLLDIVLGQSEELFLVARIQMTIPLEPALRKFFPHALTFLVHKILTSLIPRQLQLCILSPLVLRILIHVLAIPKFGHIALGLSSRLHKLLTRILGIQSL